jgi:hypothetical protein
MLLHPWIASFLQPDRAWKGWSAQATEADDEDLNGMICFAS